MLREVVGAIMAGTIGTMLLWYILPMLVVAKDQVWAKLDLNNPQISSMVNLGNSVFTVLAFVVFLVIGYVIFSYATSKSPYDSSF